MKTEKILTCFNHELLCFSHDYITSEIKRTGLFEREYVAFLLEVLKTIKTPVVFDVGANIGNHALPFATTADKVYCFEPVQSTFDVLNSNINNNKLHNIIPVKKGLSDIAATATIYINDEGMGVSSLERNFHGKTETVDLVRGDNFIAEQKIDKLDLIKIDTEFHEIHVLKGMKESLQKYRPIIATEWSPGDEKNPEGWMYQGWGADNPKNLIDSIYPDCSIYFFSTMLDKNYWGVKPTGFKKLKRSFIKRIKGKDHALLLPHDQFYQMKYLDALIIPSEKEHLFKKYFLA